MWLAVSARKTRTVSDSRLGVWKGHEVLEPPLQDFSPGRNISISDLSGAHFGEGECDFVKPLNAIRNRHLL